DCGSAITLLRQFRACHDIDLIPVPTRCQSKAVTFFGCFARKHKQFLQNRWKYLRIGQKFRIPL
ncbi:MAG: hypothetical protein AB1440_19895, partial [Pseudomonadota bacterium]